MKRQNNLLGQRELKSQRESRIRAGRQRHAEAPEDQRGQRDPVQRDQSDLGGSCEHQRGTPAGEQGQREKVKHQCVRDPNCDRIQCTQQQCNQSAAEQDHDHGASRSRWLKPAYRSHPACVDEQPGTERRSEPAVRVVRIIAPDREKQNHSRGHQAQQEADRPLAGPAERPPSGRPRDRAL